MSNEFTAAMIAGLVAGNLQQIDESTTQRSSTGLAKKINPHSFLHTTPPSQPAPPIVHQDSVVNTARIPVNVVQEPVSVTTVRDTTVMDASRTSITTSDVNNSAEILKALVDLTSYVGSIDKTLKKIATILKDNKAV